MVYNSTGGAMANLHCLFPVPVYDTEIILSPKSIKSILDLLNSFGWTQDYDVLGRSNGEYIRKPNLDILSYPETKELEKIIDSEMQFFVHELLKVDKNKHKLRRVISWANKQDYNNYVHSHFHANSQFSGVYYLSVPKESGNIVFEQPGSGWTTQEWEFNVTEWDNLNTKQKQFESYDGRLLLFPSHLRHFVHKSNSRESRYSIAFNYFVDGSYGNGTNYLTVSG